MIFGAETDGDTIVCAVEAATCTTLPVSVNGLSAEWTRYQRIVRGFLATHSTHAVDDQTAVVAVVAFTTFPRS
jgi:hypothetical protein